MKLPDHFQNKSPLTDTAGTPWQGRGYVSNPFAGDKGERLPRVAHALQQYAAGLDPSRERLLKALANTRVLVPIVAVSAEETVSVHGLQSDNTAEMSMVKLQNAQGEVALPIFSSVASLSAWNPQARPVPMTVEQAAQAAVAEGCVSLLLDAGEVDVVFYRTQLWALAQGRDWHPPFADAELKGFFAEVATNLPVSAHMELRPGTQRECDLYLFLPNGLTKARLDAVTEQVSQALAASTLVAERINSLRLVLAPLEGNQNANAAV